MPDARLGGLNVAYDIHGDSPTGSGLPVLLVMGFGLPGRVWRYVVPELSGQRRVITFDNRGAGKTDAPRGPYRMTQMATDAVRLLDHLGLSKVHLVGVSMGGMVSQELALGHRDRIASLSLLATHPGGLTNRMPRAEGLWHFLSANLARTRPERLKAVSRLLFPKPFRDQVGDAWLIQVLGEDFEPPPSKVGRAGQLSAVMHHDTRARLGQLAGLPTLVIKPERDLLIQPHCSEVLHRAIPGSQILRFADAGHGLIRQKGTEIGAALRAHFASAEA